MKAARVLFILTVGMLAALPAMTQTPEPLHFALDPETGGLRVNRPAEWAYHAGDHLKGASTDLNDSDWEFIKDTSFDNDYVPESGWTGIGWFRLQFTVDSSLVHTPMALYLSFQGAVEVYLNGQIIDTYGQVGPSVEEEISVISEFPIPRFTPITFSHADTSYVLAIRHSNFVAAPFHHIGSLLGGFGITFSYPHWLTPALAGEIRQETAIQFAFTFFPIAFALIFGLLYLFYPSDRQYLYFALLALSVAGMTYIDLELEFLTDSLDYWFWRRMLMLFNVSTIFLLLHTVHALFYETFPRQYYILTAAALIVGLLVVIYPFALFRFAIILGLIVLAEIVRVVVREIRKGRSGAWIMGIGILLFIAGISYDLLLDLGLIEAFGDVTNGYFLGFMGLLVAMAVYLGQRLAQTNRDLSAQIVSVQQLSEKNLEQERRAKEQEMEKFRLESENEKKQLELEKAKELEASYQALEAAHQNLKTTQAQLIHSEKMASLGQMAAGIAHEIKNPLNFIGNFAQLNAELTEELISSKDSEENIDELLEDLHLNASKIVEHSRRANTIVTSMMQHASGAKTKHQPVNINQLVEEYINLAYHGMRARASGFNVTIATAFDERIEDIEAAPQEIGQVLINLFNNAFDAMMEKVLTGIEGYEPRLSVTTVKKEKNVEIRIANNGSGIPPDIRDHIFEPFFTTKPAGSGTGLGLSLSYDIVVNGHGGTLSMESEKGATFIIGLPL